MGYMFIIVDKEVYYPGDEIKGSVFFELFNISFQNRLWIEFKGVEIVPPKLHHQVLEEENELNMSNQ